MQPPDSITNRPEDKPAGSTGITDIPDGDGVAPGLVTTAPTPGPELSKDGHRTAPDHTNTGWPPGVPYIVGNEACERFSFYGMRAILYVHLVSLLAAQAVVLGVGDLKTPENESYAKANATAAFHLFVAGVYALPMIGALLADRFAGKYRTILYLSLVYCAGHAVLSMGESYLWGMYLGLALIAIGSGGIKPCVSANVGDQFGKGNWHRVRTIYQIFYFSINFGSFFATLLIPFIKDTVGTSVAFGIPGVLMFIATIIFWLGQRKFVHVPPNPGGKLGLLDTFSSVSLFLAGGHLFITPELLHYLHLGRALNYLIMAALSVAFLLVGLFLFFKRQKIQPDDGFLAIVLHTLKVHLGLEKREPAAPAPVSVAAAGETLAKSSFWAPALARFGLKATEGPVAVFKIISVFFLVTIFWALFDQHSSTWIAQAEKMDLRLWGAQPSFLGIANRTLKPSQVPALNPLMVMLLIPLMNVVYALFDRAGLQTTPLRRVTVGMFITAASFVATALLQQYIDRSPPSSVWVGWQLIQYLIITIGEVMVSITGLEFAYTQAPKKMKSTVMGFWLLTVTLGNVLVAMLAHVQGPMTKWVGANVITGLGQEATFFWVFAVLSGAAAVIFGLRAAFYRPKDFAQE
jgi:POT family proton-dependent oligopeptide transporter